MHDGWVAKIRSGLWSGLKPARRMSQQDQRDQLIERARYGEISAAEADAEATRLGLDSLSCAPNPNEFRPEDETHWTLVMAVAWIAYLDLHEVREWSARYWEECFDWHWRRWRAAPDGPIHEGWHLEQRSRPTLNLLGISGEIDRAEAGKPLFMSISEARDALWIALREGFIAASGINSETGQRVAIPALEWYELIPVEGKGQIDEVRHGLMGAGYRDILVPSVALRGFWLKPKKRVEELPPTVPPEGDGFMPLYCAVQWIATEGGMLNFPANDPPCWHEVYAALLAAITSEKVRVVGLRAGEREVIAGHIFAGIQVDYPFEDAAIELMTSSELYLRSYPYLGDQHWRGGFDDALVQNREGKWTRLMVEKVSIRELWPFKAGEEVEDQRTGLAGRPSKSKYLIKDEFDRRVAENRFASNLSDEAQALLKWLTETHPNAPRPTVAVIKNNIRATYRELETRTK